MTKVSKQFNAKYRVCSIPMLENREICIKKESQNHASHHAQNSRYAVALNVSTRTLKFLEDIRKYLHVFHIGKVFLKF